MPRVTRQLLAKTATGIEGFDAVSRGGLPRERTTLLKGGPGAGKTVFALQCLAHAARKRREPGLFVAFEESTRQILANAASFDWDLGTLMPQAVLPPARGARRSYTAGGEVLMGTLRWGKGSSRRLRSNAPRRSRVLARSAFSAARIVSSSERENELRRIRSADPARAARGNGSGNGSTRKAVRNGR